MVEKINVTQMKTRLGSFKKTKNLLGYKYIINFIKLNYK